MVVKEIIKLEYPYITVRFNNGDVVTFDVVKSLSGINKSGVKRILDENNFDKATVKDHAVTWGGAGIDPDWMYDEWQRVEEQKSVSMIRQGVIAALQRTVK